MNLFDNFALPINVQTASRSESEIPKLEKKDLINHKQFQIKFEYEENKATEDENVGDDGEKPITSIYINNIHHKE